MPEYIASGSHHFKQTKYRFLILQRFKCDLNTIIEHRQIDSKSLLVVAVQILDVLEHLHDRGYAHSDIKAENLMLGKCTFEKRELDVSRLEYVAEDLAAIKAKADETASANDDDIDEEVKEECQSRKNSLNAALDSDDDTQSEEDESKNDANTIFFTPPPANRAKMSSQVEFSGSNPVRSCRMPRKNSTYEDMLSTHYLRPFKRVSYVCDDEDQEETDDRKDRNFKCYTKSSPGSSGRKRNTPTAGSSNQVTEDRIFVIDFGLAIKFMDSSGNHRPFCMDQRRAHDGTLEFTSRDAHMGAHSRRSDLECLGYNLIYWLKGSLPWKDEKLMQQPEQVHRMKEYFMTDIRVMFKHIYGTAVPTFVGQFMEYVGGLAYHDRPDYNLCRCIFAAELQRLGFSVHNDMSLSLAELRKRPRKSEKEMENNNTAVKIKDVKSMMKLGLMIPFKESASNRISPKNLRSKSDKLPKKHKAIFSWTDILSTDPDQIARQRAEKEYERDQSETPTVSRYSGKPTYAILEVQRRLKFKEERMSLAAPLPADSEESCSSHASGNSFSTTKSSRKTSTAQQNQHNDKKKRATTADSGHEFALTDQHSTTQHASSSDEAATVVRRKSGLRRKIRPTEKSISYQKTVAAKRQTPVKKRPASTKKPRTVVPNSEFSASDESSSCSSSGHHSNSGADEDMSSSSNGDSHHFSLRRGASGMAAPRYNSSCGMSSPASDEDEEEDDDADDDDEDFTVGYSPIKTRRIRRIADFKKKAAAIPLSNRCKSFNFVVCFIL